MRLIPRSLHMRMLLLSAVATVLALIIAGWVIAGVLERFVIGGLDQRLDSEITLLAGMIDEDGKINRALLARRLVAFERGPGWRWRIVGPGGTLGSGDFPDLPDVPPMPHPEGPDGRPPGLDDGRLRPLDGVNEDGAHVHARTLTIMTRQGPVKITATAPRDVVSRPIRGALAPLLAALAALAVLLGTTTVLQLRLGLRPIRRLRDQVAAIRSGARQHVDEDQITELRPLALELNALTQDNARTLAAARQSAANLAHALKTPVATLALGVRGQPDNVAQVKRIDGIIRHHLGRARVQAADRRSSTSLAPVIADLVGTVQRIHRERNLSIDTRIEPGLAVAVDMQDTQELVGNLLDNAAIHARSRVRIDARQDRDDPRRILVSIDDDGEGIPETERTRILLPGVRLDERGNGHGFGLSIVNELAGLYGGTLTLEAGPAGGLSAILSLPSDLSKSS